MCRGADATGRGPRGGGGRTECPLMGGAPRGAAVPGPNENVVGKMRALACVPHKTQR